jgi:hypothetical protein
VHYGTQGNPTSKVNIWLDKVVVAKGVPLTANPVEQLNGGWCIGKSISNVNNLTSIAGSIDEFYVINVFTSGSKSIVILMLHLF